MTHSRRNPSQRFLDLVAQYRRMHLEGDTRHGLAPAETFDGRSLPRQASRIRNLIAATGAKTILDYGCGKGSQYRPAPVTENGVPRWNSIQEYWGVDAITCYDPGYTPFSRIPEGQYDGVICTDVLEHCPEQDLGWIIDELFGYATRFVFANVACYPARKTLPNGENAHCTIISVERWKELFESAAAKRPELLWELWADVPRAQGHEEARVANFVPRTSPVSAPKRVPTWKFV